MTGSRPLLLSLSIAALAASPAWADSAPFLWKVESPDRSAVTYLFGTSHRLLLDQLDDAVPQALMRSSLIVFERDYAQDDSIPQDQYWLPRGQSLEAQLGPRLWGRLARNVVPGVSLDDLRRMRPIVAAQSLKVPGAQDSGPSMDEQLRSWAAGHGKTVAGLETGTEAFAYANRAYTVEALASMLENLDSAVALGSRFNKAYLSGDERAFVSVNAEANRIEPASVHEVLVGERNRRWLPKLKSLCAGGGAFVAVGLNHLIGDGDLLGDLRAAGFGVTRVPSARGVAAEPSLRARGVPGPAMDALRGSAKTD